MSDQDFTHALTELADFVERVESPVQELKTLANLAGQAMACRHCSILLIKHDPETGEPHLRVEAHVGCLPDEAYRTSIALDAGISGQVARSGEPLLINNLHQSPYAPLARRDASGPDDVISVPILLDRQVIGVINVDSPVHGGHLGPEDLRLAGILALVVAKSIHIHNLQGLLKTHFIQNALLRATEKDQSRRQAALTGDHERMARLIALTLYREMKEAGFAQDHILMIATEIIGHVTDAITRKR
ncbi:GAF domain-containing protein [Marinobacterium aestuariivivens]|uniref:GAF domain-containing protein n=1 Tax=Marinobacterium aestuariivivens TaxID=1698799 RepID=A0ABW2A3K2_9GAMM